MKALILPLLLVGCADFNHGPAEILHDKWGVPISTITPGYYEKFWNPEIELHVGDTSPCRLQDRGCAIATPEKCDVYLPERYSPSLEAHEIKHCYGWAHSKVNGIYAWYPKEEI